MLLLLWGARWAWGTRGLPQEVRRLLHRSVWVRRERLELSAEGLHHGEHLGRGVPHARAVLHRPQRPARA